MPSLVLFNSLWAFLHSFFFEQSRLWGIMCKSVAFQGNYKSTQRYCFHYHCLGSTAEVCPHMVPIKSKSSFLFDTPDQQLPKFNEVFWNPLKMCCIPFALKEKSIIVLNCLVEKMLFSISESNQQSVERQAEVPFFTMVFFFCFFADLLSKPVCCIMPIYFLVSAADSCG